MILNITFNKVSDIDDGVKFSIDKDDKNNKVVNLNTEVKEWFEKELKALNINTKPSVANFSFIETTIDQADKIANHLMNDGIVVRQLHSYKLPHCLRITIGTKKEHGQIWYKSI